MIVSLHLCCKHDCFSFLTFVLCQTPLVWWWSYWLSYRNSLSSPFSVWLQAVYLSHSKGPISVGSLPTCLLLNTGVVKNAHHMVYAYVVNGFSFLNLVLCQTLLVWWIKLLIELQKQHLLPIQFSASGCIPVTLQRPYFSWISSTYLLLNTGVVKKAYHAYIWIHVWKLNWCFFFIPMLS